MLDALREAATGTCSAEDCDRSLPDDPAVVFRQPTGQRHAYECACGAVTVTVVRDD